MLSGNGLKRQQHEDFVLSCIIDNVNLNVKLVYVRYG